MSRKIIGLPLWNQGETSVGATKAYLEYLKQFGDVVILTPTAFIKGLDLLVLPGGKDVMHSNPHDFSYENSDGERFLEFFDKFTLPKYIAAGTPIYGICRGMQTIMRHFNIPLVQNIWWDHGYSKDTADSKVNKLTYNKYQEFGKGEGKVDTVGSWHHQGVTMATMMAPAQKEFDVIAYVNNYPDMPQYNIVEFAEHKTLPIIVEQSHPERNDNRLERHLISKLLKLV